MKENDKKIKVSITSLAYNQEAYIENAIKSFLAQKTDFEFEILINDDCSTDSTADIIRKYEAQYPGKVIGVYHKENQFQKGIKPGIALRKMAKGKYISFCECDDYYTDPYKLQKQVDYLDSHPECAGVVHAATTVDSIGNPTPKFVRHNVGDRDYSTEEVISLGDLSFPTNSLMMRAEYDARDVEFYQKSPVGDYPLQVYISMKGYIHYIDEFMSCYRVNADSSWTNTIQSSDKKTLLLYQRMITMLTLMNDHTNGRYKTVIDYQINRFKLLAALIKHDVIGVYKTFGKVKKDQIPKSIRLGRYIPTVYYILYKIRSKKRQKKYKNKVSQLNNFFDER